MMAEKTYFNGDYHLKFFRKIPNTGLRISDENGTSPLNIYNNFRAENNRILLLAPSNLNRDKEYDIASNQLSEDDFASILKIARQFALEHEYNLVVSSQLSKLYDVQNFVRYQDYYVPMTNIEIELMNRNGHEIYVKPPKRLDMEYDLATNERFLFRVNNTKTKAYFEDHNLSSKYYIVSSGKIHLDVHLDSESASFTCNHTFLKEHNDFSNILSLTNSADAKNNLYYFEYDKRTKGIKLPLSYDQNMRIELLTSSIPVEMKTNKNGTVKKIKLPEFEQDIDYMRTIFNNIRKVSIDFEGYIRNLYSITCYFLHDKNYYDNKFKEHLYKSLSDFLTLYNEFPERFSYLSDKDDFQESLEQFRYAHAALEKEHKKTGHELTL